MDGKRPRLPFVVRRQRNPSASDINSSLINSKMQRLIQRLPKFDLLVKIGAALHPLVIFCVTESEINPEYLASDCGVSPMTVKNYISILDDTLIGFSLPGFTKTRKRKAIARA